MAVTPTPLALLAIIFAITSQSNGEVKITPDASALLVKEYSSEELSCTANSSSAGGSSSAGTTLKWEFPNGKGVAYQTKFDSGKRTSDLKIANFTSKHVGDYSCLLVEDSETTRAIIHLYGVQETKSEPTYKFGSKTAVLSCSVTVPGLTVDSIVWLKGSQPVSDLSDSERFVEQSNTSSLVIHDPRQEDVGIYTAQIKVTNIEKPYSCDVVFKDITADWDGLQFQEVLDINAAKVEPTFYPGNKTAVLSCNINAGERQIKSVVWLQNDTVVSDLKEANRFKSQPENNSLTIDKPTRLDAGLYIARFHLDGLEDPYDCKVMYKAAPFVKTFKKSKNLIEKDNMELQCIVEGYPKAVVTWYKDKHVLNVSKGEEKRIEQKPLNGYMNARLIIKDVAFDDAGEYTCEAFSDYFNLSYNETVTVRVKDKLAALWPFLGIVCEVIVLCTIIFLYEKRRNKQAEQEENNAQESDGPALEKKDGLRHRSAPGNPGA